jgi:ABC-type multidrug transport system fused ATPase/permease subunit
MTEKKKQNEDFPSKKRTFDNKRPFDDDTKSISMGVIDEKDKEGNEEEARQDKKDQLNIPPAPPQQGHGPGGRGPMMFTGGKAKLENPRGTLWKWMFSFIKPFSKKYIIFFILMVIGTIIQSVSPLISATIIDSGIEGGNYPLLVNLTIVYLSLMCIMAVLSYISQYGLSKIGQIIVYDVRNSIFRKLQMMSMTYFDTRPSGDIMSVMTNDVDQLNQLVAGQLVMLISSIISIVLSIIFMFVLNPLLATVSLVIFPIFILMMKNFKKRVSSVFKETRKTISKVTSSIQENIAGAKVVQSFGQGKKATDEFDKANKENYQAGFKARRIFANFFPLINLVTSIITASVVIFGGFILLDNWVILGVSLSVGVLTAFVNYLAEFFRPFMNLVQIQQVTESALAASDRIYNIINEKVELLDPENPRTLEESTGEITFKNVSFGYKFNGNGENNKKSEKTDKKTTSGSDDKTQKPPMGIEPPSGMMPNPQMMGQMPPFLKDVPENYKQFMMAQMFSMPPQIRQEFMQKMMTMEPKNAENFVITVDRLLAQYKIAVPGSQISKEHPDFHTNFENSQTEKNGNDEKQPNHLISSNPMMGTAPNAPFAPEMIQEMIKNLEKMLIKQGEVKMGGGGMGAGTEMGGGGMGAGMGPQGIKGMLRMLASIPIHDSEFKELPEIVQHAIREEKIVMERERTSGFVLKDVDLDIKPGMTMAIVGETGAGKTTLIKLIARFYDVKEGSVMLDGIDVRELTKANLRKFIGLVPQDSFIFKGTITDNLLYGIRDVDESIEKRMLEISKFLGLHNFIQALPDQYKTQLIENGSNISIGQRQLIAFARALITDPKILILDEATSSVDPYTETLIQDALDKARQGRTTIIIAHRLSTIKNANQIIVLGKDKRGIIEQGTHDELMAKKDGKYRRLLEMQYKEIGTNS